MENRRKKNYWFQLKGKHNEELRQSGLLCIGLDDSLICLTFLGIIEGTEWALLDTVHIL